MSELACPFCLKLADRTQLSRSEVVWEFPGSVALLGPWQFYQGYCILVAREHETELFRLSATARREYLDEMCLLAEVIEAAYQPHKMNYELLGNQVPHLHWHLFPRSLSDPDRLKPVWLALDRAERDETLRATLQTGDRETIAATLRHHLQQRGAPSA